MDAANSTTTQILVVSGRCPTPHERRGENQPEKRHSLILARLKRTECRAGAIVTVDAAVPDPGSAALDRAVTAGVLSAARLDFFRHVYAHFRRDPHPDDSFFSDETADRAGIVPYFFIRTPATEAEPMERRLAWHATDALTPIFDDLPGALACDAAVCQTAAKLVACEGRDCFALVIHPGHHAAYDRYGGYCFVNNAVFIMRLLEEHGKHPFLIDVDYHAGDGSASLLGDAVGDCSSRFVSLHAQEDYPFLPPGLPWAIGVPPCATWVEYEPLLRVALARRPAACDCLVLSIGFDTLDGDPDARSGHRLMLTPADFDSMREVLRETGLPLCAVQEGGYNLEAIPDAAEAFWSGLSVSARSASGRAGQRGLDGHAEGDGCLTTDENAM